MTLSSWMLALPLLPVGLVAGGLFGLRIHRQQKAKSDRIRAVVEPNTVKTVAGPRTITRADVGQAKTWQDHLGGVFGFNPAKADQYPIKWPIVLVVALVAGRVAVMLLHGLLGPIAWVALPIVWCVLARTYFGRTEGTRKSKLLTQFPDALAMIVRAVRVGIPVTESLRVVAREAEAPTQAEFERACDQISIGSSTEQALRDLAARNDLPEYGFFAAALTLQAQTGGGLTDTLETLAEVIRKRVAMKARGHALSSEARTSAMVLGAMPIVTGGLIGALSPDYMVVLFTDSTGNVVLGIAVMSLSIGMFLMQTIIRKALS